MNIVSIAYNRMRAEGENQLAAADRRYSRVSMTIGAFAAGLSGVCSTLFTEALVVQAGINTDIITATPAIGFAAFSYMALSDSLRTSREAGSHEEQSRQHLALAEADE